MTINPPSPTTALSLRISISPDGYTIDIPSHSAVAQIEYSENWWVMQVFNARTQRGPDDLVLTANVTKLPEGSLDWDAIMGILLDLPIL